MCKCFAVTDVLGYPREFVFRFFSYRSEGEVLLGGSREWGLLGDAVKVVL